MIVVKRLTRSGTKELFTTNKKFPETFSISNPGFGGHFALNYTADRPRMNPQTMAIIATTNKIWIKPPTE
jgi:hypothetical protein